MKKLIATIVGIGLLSLMILSIFHYWVNYKYVPPGYSLLLRYKGTLTGGGEHAKAGHWAEEGQVGILQKLRGPGRHFYSPLWWERTLIPDIEILPGQVGVVTCKLGEPHPNGQVMVDGEIGQTKHRGILRKVLGPGRYRINTYGYEVKVVSEEISDLGNTKKHSGWVKIPIGYVGGVTNMVDNPITKQNAGVQDNVLPPGLYPINPKEQQVDIMKVGYRETSIDVKTDMSIDALMRADDKGESIEKHLSAGINFPSNDGFPIYLDYTAVWGLLPEQIPNALRKFGNIDLVESKVIHPQIESICRNNGSEYSATQLLVGHEREIFQNDTLVEFQAVLAEKDINLLSGSVRHIFIPHEVRRPIQLGFISDELALSRQQEQITARQEALLREAEQNVTLATETTIAQTAKLVAEKEAQGDKEAAETDAETKRIVAEIDRKTEELKSQAKLVLGQAEAEGKTLVEEATAGKFALAVEAFGSPEAYNRWAFTQSLPDDVELNLFYAGEGTMWTDLQSAVRIMAQSPRPPVSRTEPVDDPFVDPKPIATPVTSKPVAKPAAKPAAK